MLSDTDAVHMAIDVSACLRKEKRKFAAGPKDGANEGHNAHARTHTHKCYERLKAVQAK
jgi:hypothetical protein